MADRSALLKGLSAQLAQELVLLRRFHDVLKEEHEILARRSLEKLDDVVERKQSLLDEFQTAVDERMVTLKELGAGGTESAAEASIREYAGEIPSIGETWDSLQQLLHECKEQNTVNGAVIEVSSHSLQTALSILTDRTASTELYDAKGKARQGGDSGSSLAKA